MSNIDNISIKITKALAALFIIVGALITGLTSYYASKSAVEVKLTEIIGKQELMQEQIKNLSELLNNNTTNDNYLTTRFNEYIKPDEIKPKNDKVFK